MARDPKLAKLEEIIARMNELFDGGDFTNTDIGSLAEHVAKKMLDDANIMAQVRNNAPQQIASSPAIRNGAIDAIIGAQDSYAELTTQLLHGPAKRDAFVKGLVELLYVVLPELPDSA